MSLVTVQRSPTPSDPEISLQRNFNGSDCIPGNDCEQIFNSECYFCVKGTAVILLQPDRTNAGQGSPTGEIEEHLQAMLHILHPQDTLTMAVKLQVSQDYSTSMTGARYLAVVASNNRQFHCDTRREVVLIGLNCFSGNKATIGVVIPIFSTTRVRLDGDGGIVIDFDSSLYLFRPISVQAMWTIFQCLLREISEIEKSPRFNVIRSSSRCITKASNYLVNYYRNTITSNDILRAQWERTVIDSISESNGDLGATCADAERFKCEQIDSVEAKIYCHLKEVMQTVDLDEVTSKDIRLKVEEGMGRKLDKYKDFISRQMLVIMGQLDKASQIFPYLYLGTEWNACDWQWLQRNSIEYIVNVTNEVENFFPARLKYLKIRVTDEANSELLRHWNQTNQFIKDAKEKGGSILVHCKKGISRSSSTVIAFAMKEYGWDLSQAMEHVKKKRDCVTPNKGFVEQLRTFEGMLRAFKKRHQFDIAPSISPLYTNGQSINYTNRYGRSKSNISRRNNSKKFGSFCTNKKSNDENEQGSTVKNLVGNFEAKGRLCERSSSTAAQRSQVAFRLSKLSDWTTRRSLALSDSCGSPPARQLRALTIS